MRRLWLISTPTVEDGLIWVALTEWADAVYDYWVRCPRCGGDQEMVFKRVRWEGGGSADPREVERRRLAWYECAHCSARWDDAERNAAVARGQWRERSRGTELFTALASLRPMRIGFHLRAYVSPMVSLSESAAAFLWGLKDKTRMKDFMNAHEAEPWRVYEKQRDESKMLALCDGRPAGRVPAGGVVVFFSAAEIACWTMVLYTYLPARRTDGSTSSK
jgi:phage terminase large subunit GpA-like protein